MAATKQPSIFLLLAFVTLSSIIIYSNADDCVGNGTIAVYWGQGIDTDGTDTLEKTCATGNYNIVILQTLVVIDGNITLLNFYPYCESSEQCTELQSQIEYCQRNNIKVFLSIAQYTGDYSYSATTSWSEKVAKQFADYLLKSYFSGLPGPLGNVSLDGIDINDSPQSPALKWDEFVKAINASTTDRRIYISAFARCIYPGEFLDKATKTGLIDYIWVDFSSNETCQYSNGDSTNLLNAWNSWTSSVPNSSIFLGLSPTPNGELEGYIPPDALKSKVLPTAKEAANYGGVMILNEYYDFVNNYTAQIKDSVPKACGKQFLWSAS